MNQPLSDITADHLKNIKLVCFDCDGVTVEKGTEIKSDQNGLTTITTKVISPSLTQKINNLSKKFFINFTSGRSLLYLTDMYREAVNDRVILQSEIGMYTLSKGNLTQNFEVSIAENSLLNQVRSSLISLKNDSRVEGFEPKQYLITLHCHQHVPEVEAFVKKIDSQNLLYCWWNEEAFDIGLKRANKGTGIQILCQRLGLQMENVLTVGNGINDTNMTNIVGLDISTDPKHLQADFIVEGEHLGGEQVVDKLLSL